MPFGHDPANDHGRSHALAFERVEHAKDADAMPVVAIRHEPRLDDRPLHREMRIEIGRAHAAFGRRPLDVLQADDHA